MKIAKHADIPALIAMGRKFHAKANPEWPWSASDFADTIEQLIDNGFVAMTEGGFIAGIVAPFPFNTDWSIAHEILWWAEDGQGSKLQRVFRYWAMAEGADEIRWSCRSDNERVKRFYARFSDPCETVFSEKLPCV